MHPHRQTTIGDTMKGRGRIVAVPLLPWIALGFSIALLVAHAIYLQPWTLDDAYISFRYADHFGQGLGLVYNVGEYVEGYTTFLWVLLLGVLSFLGFDIESTAKVLGFIASSASVAVLCFAYRFLPGFPIAAGASAGVLLASTAVFNLWSMSGMEVPLAALIVLCTVLLQARAKIEPESSMWPIAAGISAALATLTRPEFALVAVVLVLDRMREAKKEGWRPALLTGAAFTVIFAPFLLWRLFYYGEIVPNTFYAKVGYTGAQVVRGFRYTVNCASILAPMLAPLLAIFLIGDRDRSGSRMSLGFAGVILLLHTVYVIAVGGDVMAAYRFYSPMLPVICLLCGVGLDRLGTRPRQLLAFVLIVLAYNLAVNFTHLSLYHRVTGGGYAGEGGQVGKRGKEVGLWLREHAPGDAVIATNTAGSIPYFSRLRTIDMLGLNDAHIARRVMPRMGKSRAGHEKGDGAYVLSRRPDYIQFGSSNGSRRPAFVSDHEIAKSPLFQRDYTYQMYEMPSGRKLHLFVRSDGKPLRAAD